MAKVALALAFAIATAPAVADPGRFSITGLAGWEPQTFRGKPATAYTVGREDGGKVLQAECKASASGLVWKERVDLAHTPVLAWRWRAASVHPGGHEREKSGDDFPARVYVVRDGGLAWWRTRSLVYVWASREPAGGDWPNPYTAQAHTIVLRSGAAAAWQAEARDVRADFRRYFDLDLDAIDAVALMSDCDDTGGASRAAYGDLEFRAR